MFKKIISSLLIFVFLFTTIFAKPTMAATPTWYHSDFSDYIRKVNDPSNPEDIYAERYTAAQVEWVIYGYFAWILNSILGTELGYCVMTTTFTGSGAVNTAMFFVSCGDELLAWIAEKFDLLEALGVVTDIIGSENTQNSGTLIGNFFTENRPLSGMAYIREKASKLGVVSDVSAQTPESGFGYIAAEPIQKLWQASRDVSYFLLILAIVIMAFMVMFRVKTSPQAIITIQSAVPKLIIGVVAITFSYAIAGLMIDLMYVVSGLFSTMLIGSGLFEFEATEWEAMYRYMTMSGGQMAIVFFLYFIFFIVSALTSWAGWISIIFGPGILLMFIVVPVILAITVIKVIWALLKNFITILLLIAAGPLYILGGVIGGDGFSGWLKKLAAALAVYPVAALMMAFSFLFLVNSMGPTGTTLLSTAQVPFHPNTEVLQDGVWLPPMTGFGGLNSVWLVVSLVILSLIPKVTDIVNSAISGKPFAYGTAVGEAFAVGGAMGWGGANYLSAAQQNATKLMPDNRFSQILNTIGSFARGASGGRIK